MEFITVSPASLVCGNRDCGMGGHPGKTSGIAQYIDHTLLKPDATPDQIDLLCEEAIQYGFASVCVNSCYIGRVAENLNGSGVMPCVVVGFPLGACTSAVKAFEAAEAATLGAEEVDMVINVGAAKTGDWDFVERDIEAVVQAVKGKASVKVIIETCLLSDVEKVQACLAAKRAGAAFVKTSTGFSTGGATLEDVRLMRSTVGPEMGVKASGGIRNYHTALNMIEAGATRLGTSAGVRLVAEETKAGKAQEGR